MLSDIGTLLVSGDSAELCLVVCEVVVELSDERLEGRDEFDKTFGDQYRTEVLTLSSASGYDLSDVGDYVVEGLVLSLYFFADDSDVGLYLQGALEGDVRSRAAHELDEVPVLASRVTVALDVTDDFSVDLRSGVEAEGGLDLLVLQVTVDGLGAANDLDGSADALVVFCEDCSVGVGVVTTDDDQRTDVELLEDLETLVELSRLLELRTARADDVEAAGIAVLVDDIGRQLDVVVLYETVRTHEEAIETAVGMDLLQTVEEACDDVVPTRSLTAREDDTAIDGRARGSLARSFESELGETVCVREKLGDSFLIADALRSCTEDGLHATFQCLRELGAVLTTSLLECTLNHYCLFGYNRTYGFAVQRS